MKKPLTSDEIIDTPELEEDWNLNEISMAIKRTRIEPVISLEKTADAIGAWLDWAELRTLIRFLGRIANKKLLEWERSEAENKQ